MDFIYIKGDKSTKVYLYNPVSGTKRYIPASEAVVIKATLPAEWTAKKTIAQASVDALKEVQ
jgi:hypothetical protein